MGRHKKTTSPPPAPELRPEGRQKKRTPQNSFDPAAGKDIYEPEAIVAKRTAKGILQWQVKWRGYDAKANTWEPIQHLAGCEDMIAEFEEQQRKQNEADFAAAQALKEQKKREEAARRDAAIRESTVRTDEGGGGKATATQPRTTTGNTAGTADASPVINILDNDGSVAARKQPSKRTSEVWSCFSEQGAAPKHAICKLASREDPEKLCGEEITFAFGTTAMWNHVMWQHPDDYIKLNKEKSSKPHQQASAAAGAASGVPAQLPRMPTSKREELHKGHARWLTKKKRPFALVEDEEYRAIWRSATNGTYTPPDRTTLRSFVLELSKDGQERVRVVNEELHKDHRKPSIAGDIWSTKHHTLSLLGITQFRTQNERRMNAE